MTVSEGPSHHNVFIGFNKVVECFHHLISAFGPFEVCVTFFICLLHRKTGYSIKMQNLQINALKTDIYCCKYKLHFPQSTPKQMNDLTQPSLMRILELTLNPSIRKPSVAVELSVSLHCMYLVFSTARWARSWTVGASGSTATIFSYISLRGCGLSRAIRSSSSRYVL